MVSLDVASTEELIAALGRSIARTTFDVNQYIFRDNPDDYKVPEHNYVAGSIVNIAPYIADEIDEQVAKAAIEEYNRLVKEHYATA